MWPSIQNKDKSVRGGSLKRPRSLCWSTGERWYLHGFDALTWKLLACGDGGALARDKGVLQLILETDSIGVCEVMEARRQPTIIAPIIRETQGD
ncbi:hypothetical protein SORBI_3004G180066 [Sorghum bicolor]|uniref:RNase H type-1 domain-containing protein n=1 Tax=Sorghum bicolor TaxID=4558 RepID=A0A1Z5RN68_SORBI|nr:hypothetical protein SORBI_3004G180066 [Sorghum bicolor]